MQDKKLREAFRALVKHLNLKVMYDGYSEEYEVRNNPPLSECNLIRREDITNVCRYFQEQIDEFKNKKVRRKR